MNTSHFFTDKHIKDYTKEIRKLLNQDDLVIMNLTSIIAHIIEPAGTLAQTSTLIGTRRTLKRKADFDYNYGGVGTPTLPSSPNRNRITKTTAKKTRRTTPILKSRSKSRSRSRSRSKNSSASASVSRPRTPIRSIKISELIDLKQTNILTFIKQLAVLTCKDEIGSYYGEESVTNGISIDINNDNVYDIVIIANYKLKQTTSMNDKLQYIYGMIVVQKGECIKYPKIYAINLICANKRNISKYLLGLYLYVIKKNKNTIPQWGLLELGGNYTNLSGYCAYQKFGFTHDPNLINNCFHDDEKGNLPMSVDVDRFSIDDIFKIIKDEISLPKDELCNINIKDNRKRLLQYKIALYQKIRYVLENQNDSNYIYKRYRKNIELMYNELGIQPDYIVGGDFVPGYVLQYIDNYITQLYYSV